VIELNTVHNIDCVKGLKLVDDNSVDLIVTSPPYNVGIDYDTWKDNMSWSNYLNWCQEWLTECFRILKDGGTR
jgi:site-specific DNA-methyltransferase (adenine-specific)